MLTTFFQMSSYFCEILNDYLGTSLLICNVSHTTSYTTLISICQIVYLSIKLLTISLSILFYTRYHIIINHIT